MGDVRTSGMRLSAGAFATAAMVMAGSVAIVASGPSPALALSTPVVAPGTINTVAGWAGAGPSMGLPQAPSGLAATSEGVLVGDTFGVLRRLDPVGLDQTVVAGVGATGFSGDGGSAALAQIGPVNDVAIDGVGTIYVAAGPQIRKIATDGTITTVVDHSSSPIPRIGGVAVAPSGDVYYSSYAQSSASLRVRHTNGTVEVLATLGPYPFGGDVDLAPDGTLYVADPGQSRVVKRTTDGTISPFAGNSVWGFSGDGGLATSAMLRAPQGVAVDGADVYIADTANLRVRKVTAGVITTVAGTGADANTGDGGAALAASMTPTNLVMRAGTLYISSNGLVRAVAPDQTVTSVAGTGPASHFAGDGGPARQALLLNPHDVYGLPDGSALVADTDNHRVRRIAADGTISTLAGNGTAGFSGDGGSALTAALNSPRAVAQDASGAVYVADTGNRRVRKIFEGVITTVAGTGAPTYNGDGVATAKTLGAPMDLAIDAGGRVLIADEDHFRVRVLDGATLGNLAGNGGSSGSVGDGGAATSAVVRPRGLSVVGPDVYIADGNDSVRKVSGGTITRVAGAGRCDRPLGDGGPALEAQLCDPSGVEVVGGVIYVVTYGSVDSGYRLRRIGVDGTITTAVGDGTSGFSGDGGPGVGARVSFARGLSLDAATGNLLIADSGANRIRAWAPPASASGTIGGTVMSGGSPLPGAMVGLYPAAGSGRLATATAGPGGGFSFAGVAPGSYRLRAWSPSGVAVAEWYVDSATAAGATPVVLAPGATVAANFDLAANGAIEGTVESTSGPVSGATVVAYRAAGGAAATTTTSLSGAFSFPSLPTGPYKLKVLASGYVTEWYADAPTAAGAMILNVTAGGTVHLDGGSAVTLTSSTQPELSGRVTIDSSGLPISGAAVRLYTSAGFVKATSTAPDGTYAFVGTLAAGTTYYVRFGASGYANEWWDSSGPSFANADAIAFTGVPIANVDATLA